MEEFVQKAVHEEFVKRMEDENKRQNARLASLETAVKEIGQLTVSVEKIALSLENMVNEQKAQEKVSYHAICPLDEAHKRKTA